MEKNKKKDELYILKLSEFAFSQISLLNNLLREYLDQSSNQKNKRPKGYSLQKRENKKCGFLYYVRYYHNGKMLPTKWSTHTNNLQEAEQFAQLNRKRLIAAYQKNKNNIEVFKMFKEYYAKGSPYLLSLAHRGVSFCEHSRVVHESVMCNTFIPFLKEQKIHSIAQITAPVLSDFQDFLLAKNIKPQSVNDNMIPVRKIFSHLAMKGKIKNNPFDNVIPLDVKMSDHKIRGCHEIEKLKGVFNTVWDDNLLYIITLLIYSTGMRNSEIEKMQVCDLINIDDVNFINIKKSKTDNGRRLVPLHGFVHNAMLKFIKEKSSVGFIFTKEGKPLNSRIYCRANLSLAEKIGVSKNDLEKEYITFYSGRHFWKTLMSCAALGDDIEEVFMGHKVSNDVAKRYNHRDKQGKRLMLRKAQKVFSILDQYLF